MVFSTASRSVGQTSFPEYKELFWCGRQVLAALWLLPVLPLSLENMAPQWSTAQGNLACDNQAYGNHGTGLTGTGKQDSKTQGRMPAVGGGVDRSYYRVSTSERGRIIHQRS